MKLDEGPVDQELLKIEIGKVTAAPITNRVRHVTMVSTAAAVHLVESVFWQCLGGCQLRHRPTIRY
jgi:hypothetical protein